jgi:hypothetical protein
MKKIVTILLGALLGVFSLSVHSHATSCHPYIEQLVNGDVKLSVTYNQNQYYVEVFVRKNDIQTIAQNIVSSVINNGAGSYTYSYTYPASNFVTGDKIVTRFYSYVFNQPGVFTPGPAEQVWSTNFFYNQTCPQNAAVFVSVNGSDSNTGTLNQPVKTVAKGISLAVAQNLKEVRIAEGTYIEGNIQVANGVSLLGGYSANFTSRDITLTQHITTIDAHQEGGFMVCGSKRVLIIDQVYYPTIIEGLVLTGGRVCGYGAGILVTNANNLVFIRNNKITGNASVGNGTSGGGNIYLANSSVKLYNNIITEGFSGSNFGNDLLLESNQPFSTTNIYNNTFTNEYAVIGLEKSVHYGNKYLTQYLVHVSTAGSDANIGTNESPVKTIAKGIALGAQIHASQVRIAAGTYVEGNLNVVNGLSIYGGYNADFTTSDPYSNVTTIDAQQPTGVFVCGNKRIFYAENINLYTAISGLTMKGGRLCGYGGGIYINNCNENLVIQYNKLNGNSSVGNGTSSGGNIYIANSSAKILYNELINGFAGGGYGHDIHIAGTYGGHKTEIAYNTITSASTIYGTEFGNIHDNIYLNGNARTSEDNLYLPLEVKLQDEILIISSMEEEVNVEILDLNGASKIKSQSRNIPLHELAGGIYIIKAESGNQMTTTKILLQ